MSGYGLSSATRDAKTTHLPLLLWLLLLCPSGAEGRAKTRVELPLLCCPALLLLLLRLLQTPGEVNAVTRVGTWPHSSSDTKHAASSVARLVMGERGTRIGQLLVWTAALAAGRGAAGAGGGAVRVGG